MDVVI
jgi:hypothetical protein